MYRAFQAVTLFLAGYRMGGGHWVTALALFGLLAWAMAGRAAEAR